VIDYLEPSLVGYHRAKVKKPDLEYGLLTNSKLCIVFLHGWGMNQGIWTAFIDYCRTQLPLHISLKALDLPGHGQCSDLVIGPYTIDHVARAVSSQIPPNTIIVGWSMGGLVAQHLANMNHKHLIGHIQIASTPKFIHTQTWPGIHAEVFSTFSKQLEKNHMGLLKRFLAIQCVGVEKPKEQIKGMFEAISKFPFSSAKSLNESLCLLMETDLRHASIESLHSPLPCFRLYGELDTLIPYKAIVDIQTLFPTDDFEVIPKASHAPFFSHPRHTFEAIKTFIYSFSGQSRS
jgi:pimeloyl-[acyl-carrier protein] methyl ester esterase